MPMSASQRSTPSHEGWARLRQAGKAKKPQLV